MAKFPDYLGPEELSHPYQDVLNNAVNLPENIQRQLLGWVATAYRQEYAKAFPNDTNFENYQDVMLGNTWQSQRSKIIQNAMGRAAPVGYIGSELIPDPINTIGDASRLITRSMIPMAAGAAHKMTQGELNQSNPFSDQIPTPQDALHTTLERYSVMQALWDEKQGTSVGAFFGEMGNAIMKRFMRVEQGLRGKVGLESLNADMLTAGSSEQDPTEMRIMEYVRGGRAGRSGFRFNYLFTPGGTLRNTEQIIDTTDLNMSVRSNQPGPGYRNLFLDTAEMKALAPWVTGKEPVPAHPGLNILVNGIRAGWDEISREGGRGYDSVLYAVDRAQAIRDMQRNAINSLPRLTDVGMWTNGPRDMRRSAIDNSLISTTQTGNFTQPLMLTHNQMSYYANLKAGDGTTPVELALQKRVRYILGQHSFDRLGSSGPTGVNTGAYEEDFAGLYGKPANPVDEILQKSAQGSTIRGRYVGDEVVSEVDLDHPMGIYPRTMRDPVTGQYVNTGEYAQIISRKGIRYGRPPEESDDIQDRPNESRHEYDYTPSGKPLPGKANERRFYQNQDPTATGTYVEGVDRGPRPSTDIARAEDYEAEMRMEDAALESAAGTRPAFRQAIDNMYRPGGRGKVGKYRDQLMGNEAIQEQRDYDAAELEKYRAMYINRYSKTMPMDEAIRRADMKIAGMQERRMALLQTEAYDTNARYDALRAFSRSANTQPGQLLLPAGNVPLLTAGSPSPAIQLGSGIPQTFYSGYSTSYSQDILAKRLSAYSPEVQKAIETLMTEFPEYVSDHLGKGKGNIPNYINWQASLSDEQRAKFQANKAIVQADQDAHKDSSGAIRWMVDAAGKKWEGYGKRELPGAQSQEPTWVGTQNNGQIYINPEAHLVDINKINADTRSATMLARTLSLKSKAVIAHEASHLDWNDLSEEDQKKFINEFKEAVSKGEPLASQYSPGGPTAEEEFAQQGMLWKMGGPKDSTWRPFQKKNFPRMASFFEGIADKLKGMPARKINFGTPSQFGYMVEYDPNELSVDDLGKLNEEMSNLPRGIETLKSWGDDQLAIYAAEIGVSVDKLKKFMSTAQSVAAPQPTPATPPAANTPVEQTGARNPGVAPNPASRNATPPQPTPPSPTGTRPAPPGWVGPTAAERNFWYSLGDRQQAWMDAQDAVHRAGWNKGAVSGIDPNARMGDPEFALAGSYANMRGYTARWSANPDTQPVTGELDSLKYSKQVSARSATANAAQAAAEQAGWNQVGQGILNTSGIEGGIKSNLLGDAIVRRDRQGGPISGISYGIKTGDNTYAQTLSEGEVALGKAAISQGWDAATLSPLPGDKESAAKTIQLRMNKFINDYVDNFLKEAEAAGIDPKAAAETAGRIKTFMSDLAYDVENKAGKQFNGGYRIKANYDQVANATTGEALRAAAEKNANVDPYVQKYYGGDYDAAARGAPTYLSGGGPGQPPTQFGTPSYGGVEYPPSRFGQGGGGQGPRPSRGGMWQTNVGGALYGAYIARRMWSMTMQPQLMEAEKYGAGMAVTDRIMSAAGYGEDLMTSSMGWSARQALTQQYFQKAAWQQFGGLSDVMYSFTGDNGTLGRLTSGASLAGGAVGITGAVAGMAKMGLFGEAAMGTGVVGALGTAGLVIGGLALAGTIGMEVYNSLNPDKEPVTWGSIVKDARINGIENKAQSQLRQNRVEQYRQTIFQARADYKAGKITKAERDQIIDKYSGLMYGERGWEGKDAPYTQAEWDAIDLTQQERDILKSQETTPMQKQVEAGLTRFQQLTGEAKETFGQAFATVARGAPSLLTDPKLLESTASAIKNSGMQTNEYFSMFNTYATGMGYYPGTYDYQQALGQWNGVTSEYQRQQMIFQSSQTSRYAGSISQYFTGLGDAQRFIRETGTNNGVMAQVEQGLFQTGAYGGLTADTTVGYNFNNGAPRNYTFGEWVKDQMINGKALTPAQTSLVSRMSNDITQAGGNTFEALNRSRAILERLGEQRMNWATSLNSQILNYGGSPETSQDIAALAASQSYGGYAMAMQMTSFLPQYGLDAGWSAMQSTAYSNPTQISGMQSAVQTAALFARPGQTDYGQQKIAEQYSKLSGYQQQQLNSIAPLLMRGGLTGGNLASIAQQIGPRGDQYAYLMAQIAQGNQQAMSYVYFNGMGYNPSPSAMRPGQAQGYMGGGGIGQGNPAYFFQDMSGNPNYYSSMSGFMNWGLAQAGNGNLAAQQWFGAVTPGANIGQQINEYLGANGGVPLQGAGLQALSQSTFAYQQYHAARMFGLQMAGIGVGYQQLALQRDYLWGAGSGGSWQNPTADSLWGLENQQRAMGYDWQMYQFQYQGQRMETQNQFAMQQENLSWNRMQTTQNYQRWQMGFDYDTSLMQRQFTKENWQYQDQMRSLNYGWNLEDINEQLRYAKGRDRRQLLKERDRMVLTENLEETQIDKTRKNQEELWAREDERYEKQRQYAESMMKYDVEQFNLSKRQRETLYNMEKENLNRSIDEYKKEFELQEQIIQKNREYQAKSLELQEQSLGIQAAAAAASYEYEQNMLVIQQGYKDTAGYSQTIAQNDPTAAIKAFADMAIDVKDVPIGNIDALANMATSASKAGIVNSATALGILLNTLANFNTSKISQLILLLDDLQ